MPNNRAFQSVGLFQELPSRIPHPPMLQLFTTLLTGIINEFYYFELSSPFGQTMMKEHIECWRLAYISSASIPGDGGGGGDDDGDGGDDGDNSVISEDSSDGAPDQHPDCKQYNSLKAQRRSQRAIHCVFNL